MKGSDAWAGASDSGTVPAVTDRWQLHLAGLINIRADKETPQCHATPLFGLPAFGFLGFCGAVVGGLWLVRSIRRSNHHRDNE